MIYINSKCVKIFVLNHTFKKVIGEIHDSTPELIEEPEEWHGDPILTMTPDTIRVRFPVLCEEDYSNDGRNGTAYLSTIPSKDEILEFNRSQVLILPFMPTEDYLDMYMDMASKSSFPIKIKSMRSLHLFQVMV